VGDTVTAFWGVRVVLLSGEGKGVCVRVVLLSWTAEGVCVRHCLLGPPTDGEGEGERVGDTVTAFLDGRRGGVDDHARIGGRHVPSWVASATGFGAIVSFGMLGASVATGAVFPGIFIAYSVVSILYAFSLWSLSRGESDGSNSGDRIVIVIVLFESVAIAGAFAVGQIGRAPTVPSVLASIGAALSVVTDGGVTGSLLVGRASQFSRGGLFSLIPGDVAFGGWPLIGILSSVSATSETTTSTVAGISAAVAAIWMAYRSVQRGCNADSAGVTRLIVTVCATIAAAVGFAGVSPLASVVLGSLASTYALCQSMIEEAGAQTF
jgi:hypothetical protein